MDEIKLKKGDTVQVIAGKEKGKTGKIVKILREEGRVVVEKLNFVKRHKRPDTRGKGGIMEKEAPLDISNVAYFCSRCNQAVRIGYTWNEGKKVRICRKCKEQLD
ncbi:MAG TPA: 50S ribosomal protein L24 [Syntrophales bacterium]|nr:50S ribosomal protein L24 [Syntrophales bacterium]